MRSASPSPRSALAACALLAVVSGLCATSSAQTTERLDFTSTARFNQPEPAIAISATLHLPAGTARVPVVVIVNSSAGAEDAFLSALVEPLLNAGFAVLPLDLFTPRLVASTVRDQLQVSTLDMQKDVLLAMRALQSHPRADVGRSAVTGQSKGGAVAVNLAAEGAYALAGLRDGPRFHVAAPLAAGCDVWFKDNRLAVRHVRLFHGEADDWNPIGPCRRLVAEWAGAGGNATLKAYPRGNHSWSLSGGRYDPSIWTFTGCEGKSLYWSEDASGIEIDGKLVPRSEALKTCWSGRGATVGGDRALLPALVNDLTTFLREALAP